MGAASKIQWTDASWTPIRARLKPDALEIAKRKGYTSLVQLLEKRGVRRKDGELRVGPHCEHASPGCVNCYSETNNGRCLPSNGTGLPFDRRSRDLVDIFVDEKILMQPLRWRKPQVIFVASQTDLYGEWVTDEMIDQVKAVEALCPQHFFLELTKHPERMDCKSRLTLVGVAKEAKRLSTSVVPFKLPSEKIFDGRRVAHGEPWSLIAWPLPNVGLGVSVENNDYLWRVEKLLHIPAALRFVSAEPLLGEISGTSLQKAYMRHIERTGASVTSDFRLKFGFDWLIAGGESGPKARPCDLAWIRSLRDDCRDAEVPFFLKQLGSNVRETVVGASGVYRSRLPFLSSKGGDLEEWPADLQDCREWPEILNGWGIGSSQGANEESPASASLHHIRTAGGGRA